MSIISLLVNIVVGPREICYKVSVFALSSNVNVIPVFIIFIIIFYYCGKTLSTL